MNKILILPISVVLVCFLFSVHDANATGGEVSDGPSCVAIGGTWDGVSTCTVTNLTINSGETLSIDSGVTLSNTGTINNNGGMDIGGGIIFGGGAASNSGVINNNSGGTITIHGTVGFSNSGTINNNSGALIHIDALNIPNADVLNTGIINNSGTLTIDINDLGFIQNNGTILNLCGGVVNNPEGILGNPVVNGCLTNTSTIVTPNPSFEALSGAVTFHARVHDNSSSPTTPTGTVSWSDGGAGGHFSSSTCTLTMVSSSTSSCPIAYFAPSSTGPVTITASYSGDTTHQTSSGTSAVTVTLRNTVAIVTPNSTSVVHSGHKAFHAVIADTSGGTRSSPIGTVSWSDGGAGGHFSSSTCTLTTASSSASTCSVVYTASSSTGTVTITATYPGDSSHRASSGTSKLTVT